MERRFTEHQVSEIIRRAAEKQLRQGTSDESPFHVGIAESELRRIARELGIGEEELDLAIREANVAALEDTGTLRSCERTLERTIGGELPEDEFAVVLEEFVPVSGLGNHTVSVGRALTYSSWAGMGQCSVTVSPRNGRTTLRVRSQTFLPAIATFLPAFIASMATSAAIWEEMGGSPGTKAALNIVLVGMIWTGAWVGFGTLVRNTNRRILELTNRAAAKLEEVAMHLRPAPQAGAVSAGSGVDESDQQQVR